MSLEKKQEAMRLRNLPRSELIKEFNRKKIHFEYDTEKEGYIYFIHCRGYIKIGKSVEPENRLLALQGGNPFPLKILLLIDVPNMNKYEKAFHKHFTDYRIPSTEWFIIKEKLLEFLIQNGVKFSKDEKIAAEISPLVLNGISCNELLSLGLDD